MFKWLLLFSLACVGNLAAETKVVVFSGSTREDSTNRKLANEAADIAKQLGASITIVDLREYPMPFYDADIETKKGMPESAKRLRNLMKESNAIIIATPEYNGSISAVLKNALDWASRNEEGQPSRDAFKGKRFAIMSASPSGGGGSRALSHLRTIIQNVGGDVVDSQVSVADSYNAFTTDGSIKNPQTKEKLKQEIQQLLAK